jgi:hypothetical protein
MTMGSAIIRAFSDHAIVLLDREAAAPKTRKPPSLMYSRST